jgi:hypothetical protein
MDSIRARIKTRVKRSYSFPGTSSSQQTPCALITAAKTRASDARNLILFYSARAHTGTQTGQGATRQGASGKGPELHGMRRTGATGRPRTRHVLGFGQSCRVTHNSIMHERRAGNQRDNGRARSCARTPPEMR